MMKVGYQGIASSNTELATKKILSILQKDFELVPLVTPDRVMDALKKGEIDYGVLAAKNNTAGIVMETFEEVISKNVECIFAQVMPIHHCLFVKDVTVSKAHVKTIASHPQGIKQCLGNIQEHYPDALTKGMEDTALAAERLAKGEYPKSTAVLCTAEAGKRSGLYMLEENFEDANDNCTEFRMYRIQRPLVMKEKYQSITGYWKYVVTQFANEEIDIQEKYSRPRIVKITEEDGKLHMIGYAMTTTPPTKLYFNPLPKTSETKFEYEFKHQPHAPAAGKVTLNTKTQSINRGIMKIDGIYENFHNELFGVIRFIRITQSDFVLLKHSVFL